jgi:metal-responsive CopG/Arc/MetJ family transcriptional regulator
MKTAISLPDAIFEEAEQLARRLGKSRSELFRDALAEYLAKRDPDAITEALDRVAEAAGGGPDPFGQAASRRVLEGSEW